MLVLNQSSPFKKKSTFNDDLVLCMYVTYTLSAYVCEIKREKVRHISHF